MPSDDCTDEQPIAAGDVAAFEQLYQRHQAALYRFVRRLLGSALRGADRRGVPGHVAARRPRARSAGSRRARRFRTWLFTLAHHRVIDLLRRSGREVSLDAFERRRRRRALAARRRGVAALAARRRAQRRRATSSRSGAAPARSCSTASSSCRCRSAAPSCSITTTASTLDEVARALEVGFETAKTPPALRDEQAAHVHGRVPRAGAPMNDAATPVAARCAGADARRGRARRQRGTRQGRAATRGDTPRSAGARREAPMSP